MRLVLIGAGLGHIKLIRSIQALGGVNHEIVLIHNESLAFYRPLFHHVLSGKMSALDASIDLRKICLLSGVHFIHGEVDRVDLDRSLVHLKDRASVQFDQLSMDGVGEPQESEQNPVLSLNQFNQIFHQVDTIEANLAEHQTNPFQVAVLGASALSLTFSDIVLERFSPYSSDIVWRIFERQGKVSSLLNSRLGRHVLKELKRKNISVEFHYDVDPSSLKDFSVKNLDGESLFEADVIFSGRAFKEPKWFSESEFPRNPAHEVNVHRNRVLQSLPHVFFGTFSSEEDLTQEIASVLSHNLLENLQGKDQFQRASAVNPASQVFDFHKGSSAKVSLTSIKEQPQLWLDRWEQFKREVFELKGVSQKPFGQYRSFSEKERFVNRLKERLSFDLETSQLNELFSPALAEAKPVSGWVDKEYRDTFNDHFLSSKYMTLDLMGEVSIAGATPSFLRLFVGSPKSEQDIEILSQILMGAQQATNEQVPLRVQLCSEAMNTVQFSMGAEAPPQIQKEEEPVLYVALTHPLGLYRLLSQQGEESWQGEWLSRVQEELNTDSSWLRAEVSQNQGVLQAHCLSQEGFMSDLVRVLGEDGWQISINLKSLPRWPGVDQLLEQFKPHQDELLMTNWQRGLRYWSGQGEQMPLPHYLLWEPHIVRPPVMLLVNPSEAKALMVRGEQLGQPVSFVGFAEKTLESQQTQYGLSDWDGPPCGGLPPVVIRS